MHLKQTATSVCAEELFSSLLHRAFRGELTAPTSKFSSASTPQQLSFPE